MDAAARANLYGFFSRLFVCELDDAAVELVRGPLGRELLPDFHRSEEATKLLQRDARVATFDTDFVHLTVVDVVPYGSFFTREDGMVESGTANPIADFLRSYGFEVDLGAARALSPDHIGIALEAMSVVCAAEAEALARPDEAYAAQVRTVERELLRQHILPWAPVFFFAVERCARTTLYAEAARVAMDFVASDHELLSETEAA